MKILVTGFEPFGGEEVNPSIEAVKKLPDKIAGARIVRLEVPVVCHKALAGIEEAVNKRWARRAAGRSLAWSAWESTWMITVLRTTREISRSTSPFLPAVRTHILLICR